MPFNPLRAALGVLLGLIAISVVAEGVEFLTVTLLDGSVTTDQAVYFGIRNRLPVLVFKLVYNTGAALLGGYLAARVSGPPALLVAAVLAAVQAVALVWGMTGSSMAATTPRWMWISLLLLTPAGILLGASWQNRRRSRRSP